MSERPKSRQLLEELLEEDYSVACWALAVRSIELGGVRVDFPGGVVSSAPFLAGFPDERSDLVKLIQENISSLSPERQKVFDSTLELAKELYPPVAD